MEDKSLDDLLQSALKDFDNPVLLPAEQKAKVQKSPDFPHGNQQPKFSKIPDHDSIKLDDKPETDTFFAETAKEIDEVLESISQEDPDLAKQLKNLTDFATNVSSSDDQTALKNFSKFASMFKATLDSVSSSAGLQSEDLVDDDLNALMGNLEQLANGGNIPTSGGSSAPLNDALKTLLSKEMMYSSLICCVEEYEPWLSLNKANLSEEDAGRYSSQLVCVKKLIVEYESEPSNPSGPSETHFQRLVEMIADLQELGDFPEGLMAKVNTQVFPKAPISSRNMSSDQDFEPPDCRVS